MIRPGPPLAPCQCSPLPARVGQGERGTQIVGTPGSAPRARGPRTTGVTPVVAHDRPLPARVGQGDGHPLVAAGATDPRPEDWPRERIPRHEADENSSP